MNDGKRFSDGAYPLKVVDEIYTDYDFVDTFTVSGGTTNYDVRAQQADAFKKRNRAWLIIIWTTKNITVRFNSTSDPAIAIPAFESPVTFRNIIAVTNIFITKAAGSDVNIKVMLV